MEGVENPIANSRKAEAEHISSFFLKKNDNLRQHEVVL
uniref:GBR4 n=1 Tax=Panax ginseng TaxID=4054 RepID=Q84TC3_PANGI|nr:GBR4 [Panax ginseng]